MRVLLLNVPPPSIGSRIPDDHLPPLGLLSIGGPLIDDGDEVRLLDAEFGSMPLVEIIRDMRSKTFCSAIAAPPRAPASPPSGRTAGCEEEALRVVRSRVSPVGQGATPASEPRRSTA